MSATASPELIRQACMLMLAKAPAGKPVMATIGGWASRSHPRNVMLRFDFPGELKVFDATSGEQLFSASAEDIAAVLGGRHATDRSALN